MGIIIIIIFFIPVRITKEAVSEKDPLFNPKSIRLSSAKDVLKYLSDIIDKKLSCIGLHLTVCNLFGRDARDTENPERIRIAAIAKFVAGGK